MEKLNRFIFIVFILFSNTISYADDPIVGISGFFTFNTKPPILVEITNQATGLAVSDAAVIVTSGSNRYDGVPTTIPGQYGIYIPPGNGYKLEVTADGFQAFELNNVTFPISNNTLTLELSLIVAEDYRILPVALSPNPEILEVPEGGIGYAWFVVERLNSGNWLPVPDVNIIAEDGQSNQIMCKTNTLSYSFLSSIYHLQNAGVFSVKIEADAIGNGNPDDTETFTVVSVAGIPLSAQNQQSIEAKVKEYTYTTSWDYRIYGKFGAGVTSGVATTTGFVGGGSGSMMKIELSGLSSNPTWSDFQISRRRDVFAGLDFSIGPPNIIPFVDVGYKNETKASFPYQTDFSFDMDNMERLESLLAFYLFYEPGILFAGTMFPAGIKSAAFLNWAVETLIANATQIGLEISRFADETGMDISNSQSLDVSIGPTVPNSFGLYVGPNLGSAIHVGGSVRKTTSNLIDTRMYVSGEYDINLSVGPKWIGSENNNSSLLYTFRFSNSPVPTQFGVEFEGKSTKLNDSFHSFKLTAAIESNASWLNVYDLSGQTQKYKAWLLTDNLYVKNLLYNASDLPTKIENIGSTGVQMALQSNSFESATSAFLDTIYEEQNNDLPAILRYGVDAESNSKFALDLDLEIPIPLGGPWVIKVGGGIEASHTNEYKISDGYWVKAKPYLNMEMPDPPTPQISFADAMTLLWSNVVSGETLSALLSTINSHLYFKPFKWLPFNRSTSQLVALNNEGSYLEIREQSIPSNLDSVSSKHWKWDENSTNRSLSPEGQQIVKEYIQAIKALRQNASGLTFGIGGFYDFEPEGNNFGDSTLISIKYSDLEIIGIDENELAVFREDTLGIWHYIPSFPDPESNSVSAYIDPFSTYTLAPIMPFGQYGFSASPDSLEANGLSTTTITSDTIYNADSTIVEDNTYFTVSASRGIVLNPDMDTEVEGIQVVTSEGVFQFILKSDSIAMPITLYGTSDGGYAKCESELFLYDTIAPGIPVISSALAYDNTIIMQWDTVPDIDIAGYRIYYDTDTLIAPFEGVANVWGKPSPINVGLSNEYTLKGLSNSCKYFITMTAYDIGGNESDYAIPVTMNTAPGNNVQLYGDTTHNGEQNCFSATQTIELAGNGLTYTVENGGSTTLVAGHSIHLLPGTTIENGAYFNAYITTDGQYCLPLNNVPYSHEETTGEERLIEGYPDNNNLFVVYPNPTTDRFTLKILGKAVETNALIKVHSLYGEEIIIKRFRLFEENEFSLQGLPHGIYIITLLIDDKIGTSRIIKQ